MRTSPPSDAWRPAPERRLCNTRRALDYAVSVNLRFGPQGGRLEMLDNWLPFLFYGSFAVLIPASMVLMSFAFAQKPRRRLRARTLPFESGVSAGPALT